MSDAREKASPVRQRSVAKAGGGPSPRGWGEQWHDRQRHRPRRTIPTRVGRTAPSGRASSSATDHPHAGGENATALALAVHAAGPSPRGWGEPPTARRSVSRRRTIPTRVGRTKLSLRYCAPFADHPHAGGENSSGSSDGRPQYGPSPRGWGELEPEADVLAGVRTIPTRVGRTNAFSLSAKLRTDHPHAGGENRLENPDRRHGYGPPHAGGENSGLSICSQ